MYSKINIGGFESLYYLPSTVHTNIAELHHHKTMQNRSVGTSRGTRLQDRLCAGARKCRGDHEQTTSKFLMIILPTPHTRRHTHMHTNAHTTGDGWLAGWLQGKRTQPEQKHGCKQTDTVSKRTQEANGQGKENGYSEQTDRVRKWKKRANGQ